MNLSEQAQLPIFELQVGAVSAKDLCQAHTERLLEVIALLPEDKQLEIGQSMFYSTAEATGAFVTVNGKSLGLEKIQEGVSKLAPESKLEFEKDIKKWASENPLESQLAMSAGAYRWAAEQHQLETSEDQKEILMAIFHLAKTAQEFNQKALEIAHFLFQVNPELGRDMLNHINH